MDFKTFIANTNLPENLFYLGKGDTEGGKVVGTGAMSIAEQMLSKRGDLVEAIAPKIDSENISDAVSIAKELRTQALALVAAPATEDGKSWSKSGRAEFLLHAANIETLTDALTTMQPRVEELFGEPNPDDPMSLSGTWKKSTDSLRTLVVELYQLIDGDAIDQKSLSQISKKTEAEAGEMLNAVESLESFLN